MKYKFIYTYRDAVSIKKELAIFLSKNYKDTLFYRFLKQMLYAIFLLSLISFFMDVHSFSYKDNDLVPHLCLAFISISLIFLIEKFRGISKIKSYYAKSEVVEIDVSEKTMTISNPVGCHTVVEFSLINRVFQSYNSILIVVDEMNSFYVPNHNFENLSSRIEFISLLNDRILSAKSQTNK